MSTAIAEHDWAHADLWGPPRPGRRFGAVHAVWGLAWLLAVQALVALVVLAAIWMDPTASTDAASSAPVAVAGMLALWAVFVGWPAWVTRFRGARSLSADFRLTPVTARRLLVGLAAGLALRAVSLGADQVAGALGWTVGSNTSLLTAGYPAGVLAFVVVGTCLAGPLAEELFYRGFLIAALERWRRVPARARTGVAIAVSSLAFGLSHATGADAGAVYVVAQTGLIGAVFGLMVVDRRAGLAATGAAHVAFNTVGVLLMFLGAPA